MSGGSLEYVCYKVENAADEIRSRAETLSLKAFADHLDLVAKALHDVEWVFSGDYGDGDDEESIRAVLGTDYKSKCMDTLRKEADQIIEQLKELEK